MPVKKGNPYKKIIGILVVLVAGLSVLFAIVLREDEKKVLVIKSKIEIASKPDEIKSVSKRAAEKTPAPITKDINKKTQIPPKAENKDIEYVAKNITEKSQMSPGTEEKTPTPITKDIIGKIQIPPKSKEKDPEYVAKDIIGKIQIPLKTKPIIVHRRTIDYNKIETDREMRALMQKRKERFGLDKGVDIIIKPNESIKVGTITVPMKEILDKIRLKRGDLIIEDLMLKPLPTISHQAPKEISEKLEAYGIYVVRENDNIWNIHFSFMKDYFQQKGVLLEPQSDEPDKKGVSSGMGKILKFSEYMVYIYNIKERKLDIDLDLLYPLSKIVIFNMGEVFSLLDQIDYEHVNQIQYDGETIWLPAEQ